MTNYKKKMKISLISGNRPPSSGGGCNRRLTNRLRGCSEVEDLASDSLARQERVRWNNNRDGRGVGGSAPHNGGHYPPQTSLLFDLAFTTRPTLTMSGKVWVDFLSSY